MNQARATLLDIVQTMLNDQDMRDFIALVSEHDEVLCMLVDFDPTLIVYYEPGKYEEQERYLQSPESDGDDNFQERYHSFEKRYCGDEQSDLSAFVSACEEFNIDYYSTEWGVHPSEVDAFEKKTLLGLHKLKKFKLLSKGGADEF